MESSNSYKKQFIPYALAAFLIGSVGGFSAVLGPSFVQDIGVAYNNTTWTALAQAMSTAACAPVLGKLGDVIGHKITLLFGIAIFTLGNILSALANSLVFMIVARLVVGIGTAAMSPVIIAYIVTRFPENQIAKVFSLYMLISSASVILGPTLGALLIERSGWRTMVWVCVAICAVTLVVCATTAEKIKIKRRKIQDFDLLGAVMVFIFFGLILCIPSFGQNFGWTSAAFIGVLFAAAASFICLVAAENRAKHPILSGGFMKRGSFVLSVLAMFLTQGLMQANMTNTVIFVNYTQPDNSAISGYAISIMYLGMSLGAVILGPLADRFEPKYLLTGSLLLTAMGCGVLLLFSETTSAPLMMASLGVLGCGLGGNGTIFMKVALTGLPPQEAGAGSGTYGLFRDLAAPFGVAVFVPLFTNQIAGLEAGGVHEAGAAVRSLHTLAVAELFCVAAGIATVFFLPRIYTEGSITRD